MTITSSKGYGGTVGENDTPVWARALGGLDYGVLDAGSWKVTTVPASARTVQVAAGQGMGRGIYDVSNGSAADQVQLPNPPSGQLWHAVVVRRDTSPNPGGLTTFGYGPGASTPRLAIEARATFASGTVDEQPIALARVERNNAQILELLDVRCWSANGGLVGASDHVRWYLDRVGTQVTIGTDLWTYGRDAHQGVVDWSRTPLLRPVNLLAAGSAIAGGAVPGGAPMYVQGGTWVATTDGNGFRVLPLPAPFPNGLLTAVLTPGDGNATGATTFPMTQYGSPAVGSDRTRIVYAAYGTNGVRRPSLLHRVNWVALGW